MWVWATDTKAALLISGQRVAKLLEHLAPRHGDDSGP